MSYEPAFAEAASRHFHDGTSLFAQQRYDNAGYHFGLAAECAIKAALWKQGERFGKGSKLREHLPKLVKVAQEDERLPPSLASCLGQAGFMAQWKVDMRYAGNETISPSVAQNWRRDAETLLGMMDDV